jgi:outer membrane protein OmpA-like peptidoglycan-associated protein
MEESMKRSIAVVTMLVFGLALVPACTTDPATGQQKLSKAGAGAMIGAAGGALAGLLVGKGHRKEILIGAGIGAIVGVAVGGYMDQQEKQLKEATAGTEVEVERVGDRIKLNMPAEVSFDTGSAQIKPALQPTMDRIAQVLNENEKTYIDIIGHTDSVGTDAMNQTLSEQRARSVSGALTNRGVNPVRIETAGFGETMPIASNDTPEGRALNRRVEILLTPIT